MSHQLLYGKLATLALLFPVAILADFTQSNVTLQNGQTLSLETGAIANSGGDIRFNGNSVTVIGSALSYTVAIGVGPGGYALYDQATLKAFY